MRAWLYMVARNLYYNYYKKAKTLASLEAIHTEDVAPVSEYFIKKDVLEEILQKEGTKTALGSDPPFKRTAERSHSFTIFWRFFPERNCRHAYGSLPAA